MNQLSVDETLSKLGAFGFDEALTKICLGCALQEACGKTTTKCNARNAIIVMAINVSQESLASVKAPVCLERLKKGIEEVQKRNRVI